MQTRQVNYPLVLGAVLSALVLVVAILAPLLAPYDPMYEHGVLQIGGVLYGGPPLDRPVPPFVDARFPLGTDEIMRDVLSRVVWGLRPTLILCAIVAVMRVVVGTVVGIAAGWWGGAMARVIDSLISFSVSVPLLALAVALLLAVGLDQGILAFVFALTVTSWCDTAALVRTRTQTVRTAPYIESARAIGRRTGGVLWRHVLPQLRPLLPMILAFEVAATLLLVAELGYLGYYLGGGTNYRFTTGSGAEVFVLRTGYPELGQLLSDFFKNLYRTPWISLAAGSVVFVALVAFSLLGEGLRRQLDVTRPRSAWWWQRLSHVLQWQRPVMRWVVVAASMLVLSVSWLGYMQVARGDQQTDASPSAPAVSNVPASVEQIHALDLGSVLMQPGVVPAELDVWQTSARLPNALRNVRPPTKAFSMYVRLGGNASGAAEVLVYPTVEARDQALPVLVDAMATEFALLSPGAPPLPPPPELTPALVGERTFVAGKPGSTTAAFDQLVFTRCSAVVHVSLQPSGGGSIPVTELISTWSRSLDQQNSWRRWCANRRATK